MDKFKNNKKIAGITGNNFQKEKIQETFYYSKFSSIWGWATWRRVWKTYDLKLNFGRDLKTQVIGKITLIIKKKGNFGLKFLIKFIKTKLIHGHIRINYVIGITID